MDTRNYPTANHIRPIGSPQCQMAADCKAPVSHLDNKGFVYCEAHGLRRRAGGIPCRKLRPFELTRVYDGQPVARY